MIKISLVLLTFGYALVVVAFSIGGQSRISAHTPVIVLWVAAFLFISAGGGAFEATSIPFGVDQLQGASSEEISSYFYFFYFSRNLGMIWGITIYSLVSFLFLKMNSYQYPDYLKTISENAHINELYGVFQPLVTIMILVVGIILIMCLHHWFFKNALWENPVRLIANVLCYAATVKRHLPVRNRAFRYGEEKKKRVELAKIQYDGRHSAENVEDVKTFCRIIFLLFTLLPALLCMHLVCSFHKKLTWQ
jgi:peptide/histidine transporter 3/4